jgi:hypothetical protein
MKVSYTNLEITIFIIVIINAFFESVIMFVFDTDIYNFSKLSKTTTEYIKIYYNIANFLLVGISLYLLLVKKVRSLVAFLICIILLIKGFFHFVVAFDLYKLLNLTPEQEQQFLSFHDHEAILASIINVILSSYLLYKIF